MKRETRNRPMVGPETLSFARPAIAARSNRPRGVALVGHQPLTSSGRTNSGLWSRLTSFGPRGRFRPHGCCTSSHGPSTAPRGRSCSASGCGRTSCIDRKPPDIANQPRSPTPGATKVSAKGCIPTSMMVCKRVASQTMNLVRDMPVLDEKRSNESARPTIAPRHPKRACHVGICEESGVGYVQPQDLSTLQKSGRRFAFSEPD